MRPSLTTSKSATCIFLSSPGLNPRSIRAFLFFETGVACIAYRCIILALHYMLYVIELPHGDAASPARAAA